MAESTPDWSQQFHDFLASPLGRELIRVLQEDLHTSLITDAEKADSQEKAYGLLKQASGVMLSVSHLKSKAVVPKK
jgi:outer membrane biogenesis lipoprotein LolB